MPEITLLTGQIQSGKTSLCLEVVKAARQAGFQLGGLISPGVFEAGMKTGIDILDISSGERRRLADRLESGSAAISTRRWSFLPEAVAWGNEILAGAVPCDLLIIDELGPLEFLRGEGWLEGFHAVRSHEYQAALLVIRPSLLQEALDRWEAARIVNLDDPAELLRSGSKMLDSMIGYSQKKSVFTSSLNGIIEEQI